MERRECVDYKKRNDRTTMEDFLQGRKEKKKLKKDKK